MITKEEAKEKIKKLVETFSENPKYWDAKPEEDIKFQFIEPLFEALGWERKEISKEQRVLKGRADYILKSGNQELLVIEAKKTNVHLTDEEGKQAVSYAYHRKIKFSVLTNFKYIYVYHALSNIKNIGKNLLKVNNDYFRLEFKELLDKFDVLWLLSKESFEKGEINKLLSSKDEKLNKPIDINILEDLLYIRELLSKELKSKKNYLEKETIDEVIQILIDRLIFIRSIEDRGLEPMNYLRSFESDVTQQRVKLQLFPYLLEKFEEFNQKYDSKLFEKGLLEKEGTFSDDVLRKVILTLYFGRENNQERYLFDQIPGDLFGSIYEQYLGTILSGTEKRVKLEGGTGKRKKMGIYYTPSYIVDYIVKNTVYEYIKDKSIDEILEVNILDPACGSGSFITRAFVEVCNVVKDKLNQGEEGSKALFKKQKGKIEELNLGQKIEILRNCIYGVDLDEKAVELARLNLLLKLLEGETQETRKMLLPHLEDNIKCGNSLIDDPKVSDRAFNWNAQFQDVFRNGGFDVVIGNPPYVFTREVEFQDSFKKYVDENYFKGMDSISKSHARQSGKVNLYALFLIKSIKLLKEKSLFGFIIPNNLLRTTTYDTIRKFILDNCKILSIADLGEGIFEGVTASTIVLFLQKESNQNKRDKNQIIIYNDTHESNKKCVEQEQFLKNTSYAFNITLSSGDSNFLEKLWTGSQPLGEIAIIHAGGIATGPNKKEMILGFKKNDKYKPMLEGKDIKPFYPIFADRYILYEKKLLYRAREESIFLSPEKIVTQRIGGGNRVLVASYDNNQFYTFNSTNTILAKNKEFNLKYLTALLNSKLLNYYYTNKFTNKSNLTVNISKTFLENLPIRLPSPSQEKKIISLVNDMLELQKKYHNEKTAGNEKERLKQQIDNVDYEIDEEVYKLYGITDEEKKIIEESLK